ncbi:MAG: DUF1127 domain-containing protein [Rubricella sp.]
MAHAIAMPRSARRTVRRETLLDILFRRHAEWVSRRHLATLDTRALRDIGLTEGEALRIARRA